MLNILYIIIQVINVDIRVYINIHKDRYIIIPFMIYM